MTSFASRISFLFTAAVLSATAFLFLFAAGRLEYCGQPDTMRPQTESIAMSKNFSPTLASPQKVINVRIETDQDDVEINWSEN
jgi:hypothetical protein